MTLFSSLIAGFLWKYIGAGAPFIFGGIMAAVAFIVFFVHAEIKEKVPI
jgi:predicted MFS family arabinose efflux permease